MKKVMKLLDLWQRGLITVDEFWDQMNQLDRVGDINDDDWVMATNIVPPQ